MIKLSNLTKIYTTDEIETTALHEINLFVDKGEFLAIEGPSGCGKTTLLNIIGLIDTPTKGEIEMFSKPVHKMKELERTRFRKGKIGYVFQKFNLIDTLTVYENIELPLLYMKVSAADRKKLINSALNRLDIAHRAKHFPYQLSGGQQQRVAVSRCMVTEPELILADEPTGNLDTQNGDEVMQILSELHSEGKTVVLVTHEDKYAHYARRVVKLLDGVIQ